MNLQENIHRIREVMGVIVETRGSYMNYIKVKVKEITGQEWPDYVLRDWLYKNTKDYLPNYETKKYDQQSSDQHKNIINSFIESFIEGHGKGHWEYRVLSLSIESFTDFVKQDLIKKIDGFVRTDLPKDSDRHDTQQSQIEKKGISPEPIMVVLMSDGKYELLEGWHRTTAALKAFGQYKQNAWVYIKDAIN